MIVHARESVKRRFLQVAMGAHGSDSFHYLATISIMANSGHRKQRIPTSWSSATVIVIAAWLVVELCQ
jgi:hypothetical protein